MSKQQEHQPQNEAGYQLHFRAGNQPCFEAGLSSKVMLYHQPKNKATSFKFELVKMGWWKQGWLESQGSIVSDLFQTNNTGQRFCNPHDLLRLPRSLQRVEIIRNPCHAKRILNLQQRPETVSFLTVLTSKSLSRHSVVQILRGSTSKSAQGTPSFNDFDLQTALAPQRGANFVDILGSRSSATSVFGSWLCEPAKP